MIKRIVVSLFLTMCLMLNVACGGPLSKLNKILPHVPTTIDTLVVSGLLDQDTGEVLKSDFNDGLAAVNKAKARLAAGESKAVVYADLANEWRMIVARNHFAQAGNAKINTIVGLISTIVSILVGQQQRTLSASAKKDLDRQLEAKIDELEKEVVRKK
jgi:hypothetical protein